MPVPSFVDTGSGLDRQDAYGLFLEAAEELKRSAPVESRDATEAADESKNL